MSQIGAAFLLDPRLSLELARGRLEIACLSSDGIDGTSGSAGTYLGRAQAVAASRPGARQALERALRDRDTAPILRRLGALIPQRGTGTNVQDLVVLRILADR